MEQVLSLSTLRSESGKGIATIIKEAKEIDPLFPTTHAGYLDIERKGTPDYYKIRALACVFGFTQDEMAVIVRPEKRM